MRSCSYADIDPKNPCLGGLFLFEVTNVFLHSVLHQKIHHSPFILRFWETGPVSRSLLMNFFPVR